MLLVQVKKSCCLKNSGISFESVSIGSAKVEAIRIAWLVIKTVHGHRSLCRALVAHQFLVIDVGKEQLGLVVVGPSSLQMQSWYAAAKNAKFTFRYSIMYIGSKLKARTALHNFSARNFATAGCFGGCEAVRPCHLTSTLVGSGTNACEHDPQCLAEPPSAIAWLMYYVLNFPSYFCWLPYKGLIGQSARSFSIWQSPGVKATPSWF